MNRYWLFLLTLGFMTGCQEFQNTNEVYSGYTLEFTLTGGFAGAHNKLTLSEDGAVEASNGGFLVSAVVSQEIRALWLERLNDVGFFALDDDYPPAMVIMDGFYYELTVTSQGQTKIVTATDRGGHPDDLHELFWDLFYELFLPVYRDSAAAATVLIRQQYLLQTWPFISRAPLMGHIYTEYTFSEIDSTGEIERYLKALYYPGGTYHTEIRYLHQEGDFLYRFTMLDGGFKINSAHPVRNWPADLNLPLSDIPDEGVVVQGEAYQEIKALLIEPLFVNSIFIEGPAAEDVAAYYVAKRNGVCVGWP